MINDILNTSVEGINIQCKIITQCPICKSGVPNGPRFFGIFKPADNLNPFLYTVTECFVCKKPFFSIYPNTGRKNSNGEFIYNTSVCYYPPYETQTEFGKKIHAISPEFLEIYHEAERAEAHGLTRICGAGYRKALEFLIKDYLIKKFPDKTSEIEKDSLGNVINDFLSDEFKESADIAKKIGNDHVHHKMKYLNSDIEKLKESIASTVYWLIHSDLPSLIKA